MSNDVYNLRNFEGSIGSSNTRSSGGFNIVYSKNGCRVNLSYESIMKHLGDVETVQIAYSDDLVAIGKALSDEFTDYQLSGKGKGKIIYNAGLVRELIETYDLDYEGRTSRSFPVSNVETYEDDSKVVFINMKQDES